MKTTIKEQDGNVVAVFEGRLDTASAVQTENDLKPLAQVTDRDIIFDCTNLAYISSSGLRLFLSVLKNAKANGQSVYITGMNADIRNIFAITGFINLFQFK